MAGFISGQDGKIAIDFTGIKEEIGSIIKDTEGEIIQTQGKIQEIQDSQQTPFITTDVEDLSSSSLDLSWEDWLIYLHTEIAEYYSVAPDLTSVQKQDRQGEIFTKYFDRQVKWVGRVHTVTPRGIRFDMGFPREGYLDVYIDGEKTRFDSQKLASQNYIDFTIPDANSDVLKDLKQGETIEVIGVVKGACYSMYGFNCKLERLDGISFNKLP